MIMKILTVTIYAFIAFFLIAAGLTSQAQNCDCTTTQVLENTVTPCNLTIGTEVTVNSISTFQNALNQANSSGGNMTILIANGTYQIASTVSFPHIAADNVVIRSLSGNRDSVIIRGGGMVSRSSTENGFLVSGNNVTIADLTIKEVANHGIQVSGHNLFVHNVRIQNTFEQMIKGSTGASSIDSAVVQCALMEYPMGIGPEWYIGGLDIHKGVDWLVRDNVFKSIISPSKAIAEHAVHFWDSSSNNTVERNLIVNCDRGIGFGLGSSQNTGGIIRNNMIYNDGTGQYNDVGISLETSPDTRVYNNTIHIEYFNAIEYRYNATTNVDIKNNLTNQSIASRNGGKATLNTNLTNAQPSWYQNVNSGNLRLAASNPNVVDQGTNLTSFVLDDIDKSARPQGMGFDIGAHEYKSPLTGRNEIRVDQNLSIFPNPSTGMLTIVVDNMEPSKLALYNLYGEITYSTRLLSVATVIDFSHYAKGIYFYRIENGLGLVQTGKIIIQ
ncbi:MAG: hypothetical protein ACI9JN_000426 [Bacteroidia bacterium]|jgi:hypothetical protein